MKIWLHKIELIVDRLIPYSLIALFFVIVGEIFFSDKIGPYGIFATVIDGTVLFIFVLDLVFKYIRTSSFPGFLRKYWIEIIAVFPVFLVVRLIEEFASIPILGETMQKSLHETLEVEKEGKILIGEIEKTGKEASRLRYFSRFIRPLTRMPRFLFLMPRFLEAFRFYERPAGKHHPYEKK